MASFKSCWAANSLNGLKRLNGAGELPRSMVREAPGRHAGGREAGYSQLARPLCEYGSCQCTRLTDVSSEPNNGSIEENAKRRGTQRRVPARPIFLNGLLKEGPPVPAIS